MFTYCIYFHFRKEWSQFKSIYSILIYIDCLNFIMFILVYHGCAKSLLISVSSGINPSDIQKTVHRSIELRSTIGKTSSYANSSFIFILFFNHLIMLEMHQIFILMINIYRLCIKFITKSPIYSLLKHWYFTSIASAFLPTQTFYPIITDVVY